jgi:N-methylhydantoinase A/oxoprolinase/acetone carboxylase beta subunit
MIKKKAVEIIGGRIQRIISSTDCPASAFSLVAVGGGGGCIGSEIADLAGLPKTYLFRQGPVFGAFGSSWMDIMHQYRERIHFALAEEGASLEEIFQGINGIVLGLQRTAARDMSGEGFKPEEIRFEVELELESIISAKSARLCLPSPFLYLKKDRQYLKERIADLFLENVDNISLGNFLLTSVLVKALGGIPHANPVILMKENSVASARRGWRRSYVEEEGRVDAQVYMWDDIAAFQEIEGPALIENRYTTVLVPPRKTMEFDDNKNGVVKG